VRYIITTTSIFTHIKNKCFLELKKLVGIYDNVGVYIIYTTYIEPTKCAFTYEKLYKIPLSIEYILYNIYTQW